MKRSDQVLIVDGLRETADVLRAVLAPRGLDVARIRGDGAFPAGDSDAPIPRVVVIHQEGNAALVHSPGSVWSNVPRVIISSDDLPQHASPCNGDRQHYLRKPFQYGDLVQAIERLLDSVAT